MAFDQNRRLRTEALRDDQKTFVGVQALGDYQPHSLLCTSEAIAVVDNKMKQSQKAEIIALNAYEAARTAAIADEWAMHNVILVAKAEVIAQYGPDSDAVQSLGLKRKSERRRPLRRKAPPAERMNGEHVNGERVNE